jgi:hypothetical protein
MNPPYIPPPDDRCVKHRADCQHCGGPVDLIVDDTFECRCCGSTGKTTNNMGSPRPPKRIDIKDGDDLAQYMARMENGYAMRIVGEGRAIELEVFAHLLALNKDKDRINICVLMMRPGAAEAVGIVESLVFPSDDETLSSQWEVRIVRWENLTWQVLSFDKDKLEEVAMCFLACGFRVVDGIPTMLVGGETHYFPIRTEKTYTIENMPAEEVVDIDIKDETTKTPPYPGKDKE